MNKQTIEKIIALIKNEVKPALGCTEPMAVSLAVAKSTEVLSSHSFSVNRLEVEVSANILKNGMGVGIPGTDMIGLHIASALGTICGKSEYGLEVLKEINAEAIAKAKKIVEEGKVKILLASDPAKLYVKAKVYSSDHVAETVIKENHDSIIYVGYDGVQQEIIANDSSDRAQDCHKKEAANKSYHIEQDFSKKLTVKEIYDFAMETPIEMIAFLQESVTLNKALSIEGLTNNYGLKVGKTIACRRHLDIFGDSILTYSMAATAAASDARMAGCTLPAMSNSGSGNQGITVTMPVIAVAEKMNVSNESLLRALAISHLVAIHIKGYLGKLSALCGCVIASTGSSCGIVYLRGGSYEQICYAIKNMIGNITGMVCDGAKVGCALKVASGVSSSIQSAILALDNICISSKEGIIEEEIEKTISNLGHIGSEGMCATDKMILDIMIKK